GCVVAAGRPLAGTTTTQLAGSGVVGGLPALARCHDCAAARAASSLWTATAAVVRAVIAGGTECRAAGAEPVVYRAAIRCCAKPRAGNNGQQAAGFCAGFLCRSRSRR